MKSDVYMVHLIVVDLTLERALGLLLNMLILHMSQIQYIQLQAKSCVKNIRRTTTTGIGTQ